MPASGITWIIATRSLHNIILLIIYSYIPDSPVAYSPLSISCFRDSLLLTLPFLSLFLSYSYLPTSFIPRSKVFVSFLPPYTFYFKIFTRIFPFPILSLFLTLLLSLLLFFLFYSSKSLLLSSPFSSSFLFLIFSPLLPPPITYLTLALLSLKQQTSSPLSAPSSRAPQRRCWVLRSISALRVVLQRWQEHISLQMSYRCSPIIFCNWMSNCINFGVGKNIGSRPSGIVRACCLSHGLMSGAVPASERPCASQ